MIIMSMSYTHITTFISAGEINLNLSSKISLRMTGRNSDKVTSTNDFIPVTLTCNLLARSIGHITISGKSIVIIRKAADTNGSPALSIDHRFLLKDIENEDTRATGEASDKEPVVCTSGGGPLDLRGTAARWVIIVNLHAIAMSLRISLIRAVVVELQNSIVASV